MSEERERGPDRRQAARGGRRSGDEPGLHPNVLVVDDLPAMRELLTRYLKRHRFQVETAGDGMEALARILAKPPHLIVTDMRMPLLGGAALLERLAGGEQTRQIPVVIYSSETAGADVARGLARAAFVPKPAPLQQILDGIREVLRSPATPSS